jgi:hypothetical protein
MVLSERTQNKQYNADITNNAGVIVTMYIYIKEMPGLNFGQFIGFPQRGFSFVISLQADAGTLTSIIPR